MLSATFPTSFPTTSPLALPLGVACATCPDGPEKAVATAARLAPHLLTQAAATDEIGGFPTQEMAWLRESGLLTAALPPALGGVGLGEPTAALALLQTLYHVGRGNLAVGRLFEGHVNALLLIQRFGKPAQVARFAADARAGHVFGVWNTENPTHGVRLEYLADGRYRLHGAKTFASGAGHITRPLLTGALPGQHGWQMLVLPADEQRPRLDRSFWRPLGMRATASFLANLERLEIDADCLLGQPNDYYQQPWFGGGAARFAAVQLGGAAAVLDETRRFLRSLGRTDDPYQRQRLGEMLTMHQSGQLWLQGAASQVVLPVQPGAQPTPAQATAVTTYANLMRTATEEICLRTLQLAERAVGARGLLQPEPFERLHRDLTHYLRQPAPDAILAEAGRLALDSDKPSYELWGA
ncbi:MAG TPA: acyl-CoA dehydrogenase family protein [Hymenobacter sp.]|uniref:acyl-CoA dehydrogenase family protein n=1 Tax=Hymenobacter sp. TaxID=1898978 RepID=UPI002D7F2EA1|nr:acyl-CoA dehydrogenase family protein [Hymenobacter sp.]HET9505314.1 acyl-CoA dehydrogenase family protein [Hymenobacter sp.]